MSKNVLVLLIDALGYNFISKTRTPYLWNFANQNSTHAITPVLGYSDSQRAAIFTGKQPQEIGYWLDSQLVGIGESPYKAWKYFQFVDKFPGDFPKRVIKYGLSKTVGPIIARKSGYKSLPIYNTPIKALNRFQPSLNGTMFEPRIFGENPTIFDVARESGLQFNVLQSDSFGLRNFFSMPHTAANKLANQIANLNSDASLTYIYLHNLDILTHRYGVENDKFHTLLESVDEATRIILEAYLSRFGKTANIILVSDHGMNHTKHFVDLTHLTRLPGFGSEFLIALDSTMVRSWYFNPEKRPIIRSLIENSQSGEFITQEEITNYGINFETNKYFEDIYLLRPGFSLFPNYHSYLKPYAMHAYAPENDDQTAIGIFSGESLSGYPSTIPMQEVYKVILRALELG
tara:strand:+ start:672 stop:1880 length:1209 start_codon:yes stop_codon:yes gene_type:complete